MVVLAPPSLFVNLLSRLGASGTLYVTLNELFAATLGRRFVDQAWVLRKHELNSGGERTRDTSQRSLFYSMPEPRLPSQPFAHRRVAPGQEGQGRRLPHGNSSTVHRNLLCASDISQHSTTEYILHLSFFLRSALFSHKQ